MVAMNKYTISYAKSLVAATPQSQLGKCQAQARKGLRESKLH